jgi:putative ubiquitin-RnfH superfamily antitoxin RatB of RatAB toxin-antitoxin module
MTSELKHDKVEIVWSHGPRSALSHTLDWTEGQSVLQVLCANQALLDQVLQLNLQTQSKVALDESTLSSHLEELRIKGELFLSVWGHPCQIDTVLKPLDRIELSRALKVDPKVARRERFQAQGAKSAGLFAKKRPGAKSGY